MSLSCNWFGLLQNWLRLLFDGSRRLHQTLYILLLVVDQPIVKQIIVILSRLNYSVHGEVLFACIGKNIHLVIFDEVVIFRWGAFKFGGCLFFLLLLFRLFLRKRLLTL
jgi:hypothetical protein